MVIGLLGEGKNDYGVFGRYEWEEGAIQPLLRKFEQLQNAEIIPITKQKNKTITHGRKFKRTSALQLLLRQFCSERRNIDLIVVFKDCDKTSGRKATEKEAKRKFKEIYQFLRKELDNFKSKFDVNGVPMIPIRMLENWLLGDEMSFRKVWDDIPKNPKLPKNPEFIWGDEQDRNSNHPKNYITKVLGQYDENYCTENFIKIVKNINIETLRKTCPNSFGVFYSDISELMGN